MEDEDKQLKADEERTLTPVEFTVIGVVVFLLVGLLTIGFFI